MRYKNSGVVAFLSVAASALLLDSSANAQNLLVNGSFEQGTFTDTGGGYDRLLVGSTAMTGWTVVTNEIVWGGPNNTDNVVVPDGQFFLDITSYGRVNPIGGISQTITTLPGTVYHLSLVLFNPVDAAPIGVLVNAGATLKTLTTSGGFDFTATGINTPITINGSQGGFFVGLDNVSVTGPPAAVPEPGSIVLLAGMTITGATFLRRRKQAHKSV